MRKERCLHTLLGSAGMGIFMNRLSRTEVRERVEKIRQGLGSDHEVNVWIEEILTSVPNREVIKTIMAGEGAGIDEIVERLYTADVICL